MARTFGPMVQVSFPACITSRDSSTNAIADDC